MFLDVIAVMRSGVFGISVGLSLCARETSPELRKGLPGNFILVGFSKMARSVPFIFKM